MPLPLRVACSQNSVGKKNKVKLCRGHVDQVTRESGLFKGSGQQQMPRVRLIQTEPDHKTRQDQDNQQQQQQQ